MDLKKHFHKWFYEDTYGLTGTRAEYATFSDITMIEAAYRQGALDAAKDTLYTLGQYGTALAGIESENITPTEMYDNVSENLEFYYKDVFGEDYESEYV